MSAPELKPCPFCGEAAEFKRLGDRRASTIVSCTYCGASLECGEEWDHGSAWNTRADLPPTLEQVLSLPGGGRAHTTLKGPTNE
jgi:Lar family restriction alleviation protein